MIHANAIEQYLDRQELLCFMDGNCGRKVRRFIEQYFSNGVARFSLKSEHVHPLQFAVNISEITYSTLMAERAVLDTRLGDRVAFYVQNIDTVVGTLDVIVDVKDIPEGLKARQEFIKDVGFCLRRVLAIAEVANWSTLSVEERFSAMAEADDGPIPADATKMPAQFDKLLASDFSEFWDTPMSLVTLARPLNPQIDEFIMYDYDRILDEAFAVNSTAVTMGQLNKLFDQALVA